MKRNNGEAKLIKRSTLLLYFICGFLFTFFVFSEYKMAKSRNIDWNAGFVSMIMALSVAGGALAVVLAWALRHFSVKLTVKRAIQVKYVFPCSFVLTILSWLPVYLAYYPGICAYDAPIQLGQIFNKSYNTHHPLFHTLFLEGCIKTGEAVFNSQNAGVGLYTLVQMIVLAAAFAFMLFALSKKGMKLAGLIICQILFMFYPFNAYMAVSITKDVIFSALLIFFLASALLIFEEKSKVYDVIFTLSGIGVCLFRNNGLYAHLFMLVVVFIIMIASKESRKKAVRLLVEGTILLAASLIMMKAVAGGLHAEEGDKREMLSVPIQQLARTMVYHEAELTEEEKSLINEFILYEGYRDYNPVISDPCKGKTNTSVVRYQTGRFLKTYVRLFTEYPGDYINAFLALVGGYVSPFDETYRLMEVDGKVITRNYIQYAWTHERGEYGDDIFEASLLPGLKAKLDEFALYDGFNVPILKVLFVPGIILWLYFVIFIEAVDKKNIKKIIPLAFVIGFYLTLFLGPTMHLRYLYPLIAVLPMFAFDKE